MTDETKPAASCTRRTVIAGALSTALLAKADLTTARTGGRKPNFLFIMADDLGYADLSCYGRREYETPVLDSLASQGTKFQQAYANSSVCSPTRVALITGRYQYRLPIGLEEPLVSRDVGLSPELPTMPSMLKKAGYRTSLIGKWHLGQLPNYGPLKSGYDEFWGIRSGGVDYFTHELFGKADLWDGETPIEQSGYLTDLLADRTIATLEKRKRDGDPWLISLHLTAPHWPWEGPGDKAVSDQLKAAGPTAIVHFDGGSMKTYAEMVTSMDRQIGRILAKLTELGMDQDTVVVFTSDNGGERFSDTWPFTGKKGELLEGGLRIPAIVRWPGVSKPGTLSEEQIISMDWMPTFLAAAGVGQHRDSPCDGIDIRPAVAGNALPPRELFWRYKTYAQRAMRSGKWKYLVIGSNSFLFDVQADPLERANLKKRFPQKFDEMVARWEAWDAKMLPIDPESASHTMTGSEMADHFGSGN